MWCIGRIVVGWLVVGRLVVRDRCLERHMARGKERSQHVESLHDMWSRAGVFAQARVDGEWVSFG